MSETVQSALFEILKKIQGELAEHRKLLTGIDGRVGSIEGRFDHLEDLVRKQRRDTAGILVMAKSVMGDFAEQVAVIEERVAVLEARCR